MTCTGSRAYAPVAQWTERHGPNVTAGGSNPSGGTGGTTMSHTSRMSSLGASTEMRVMARTIFGNDWCTASAGRIGREYWAVGAVGSALPWRGRGHRFDPGTVHHFDNRRVARAQWIREFLQRRLYVDDRTTPITEPWRAYETLRRRCDRSGTLVDLRSIRQRGAALPPRPNSLLPQRLHSG